MSYIKKFNESNTFDNIEDYFLDFIDKGFKLDSRMDGKYFLIIFSRAGHYDNLELINILKKSLNEIKDNFTVRKMSVDITEKSNLIRLWITDLYDYNERYITIEEDGDDINFEITGMNMIPFNTYTNSIQASKSSHYDYFEIVKIIIYGKDLNTSKIIKIVWTLKDINVTKYTQVADQDNYFNPLKGKMITDFKIDNDNSKKIFNFLKDAGTSLSKSRTSEAFKKIDYKDLIKK